jgi:hypothetical protein
MHALAPPLQDTRVHTHTHHNSEMPALPAGWTCWHAHLASPFSPIQPRPCRPLAVLRLACVSCLCCSHSPHLQPPHTHAYHTHLCTRGKDRLAPTCHKHTLTHIHSCTHTQTRSCPSALLERSAPAFTTTLPLGAPSLLNSREVLCPPNGCVRVQHHPHLISCRSCHTCHTPARIDWRDCGRCAHAVRACLFLRCTLTSS